MPPFCDYSQLLKRSRAFGFYTDSGQGRQPLVGSQFPGPARTDWRAKLSAVTARSPLLNDPAERSILVRTLKVALVIVFSIAARQAGAQWYQFSDFVGNSQSVVHAMSSNPAVGGAGEMVWVTQDCGARTMLFWMKGLNTTGPSGPAGPWGTEVHYLEDSFWKSLHDNEYTEFGSLTGQLKRHLVFRDEASHRKGFKRFHEAVQGYAAHYVAPYHEEHWNLACDATYHLDMPVDGTVSLVLDFVQLNAMTVLDCRGNNDPCSPATPVSIDVWEHWDFWLDNVETYRFGRWVNPTTNQSEGLGLVQWTRWGPDIYGCPPSSPCTTTLNHVVQGVPYMPCVTCPDN